VSRRTHSVLVERTTTPRLFAFVESFEVFYPFLSAPQESIDEAVPIIFLLEVVMVSEHRRIRTLIVPFLNPPRCKINRDAASSRSQALWQVRDNSRAFSLRAARRKRRNWLLS